MTHRKQTPRPHMWQFAHGDVLVSQKLHSEKGSQVKKSLCGTLFRLSSAPVENYVTNKVWYV